MRVVTEPRRAVAYPGQETVLTVTVTNTSDVIARATVRFLGADASWATLDIPTLRLVPGSTEQTQVRVRLPEGVPAGERQMAVQVTALGEGGLTSVEEVTLEVPRAPRVDVRLEPATVTAGRRAVFGVVVENTGNTTETSSLVGSDAEGKVRFGFVPDTFVLAPGEQITTELRARGRRPWFGSPAVRPFELRIADPRGDVATGRRGSGPAPDDADAHAPSVASDAPPPAAIGVLVQRPVFNRGLMSMLGLLVAVSVFAVVIAVALTSVVNRSAADRDLALQVAQARDQGATTGTSSVAGTVRLLSSDAVVPGVAVEAFDAADPTQALATTATDEAGAFELSTLAAGEYKLRFRGAGFSEVWYPSSPSAEQAQAVVLAVGESATGLVVLLGGVPATLSGVVVGADVAGATVQLELPMEAPDLAGAAPAATSGAVVRSVPVGADGSFQLDDVPSPNVYDIVVSKPGFSTQVQRVDVAAGELRTGIEIRLLEGDGTISGTVVGAQGPIGDATVIATAGDVTVRTVTLTDGDVGSFTLRNLPTPATFTVVVAAEGYSAATLSLDLAAGQALTGVSATLGVDSGRLGGMVSVTPSSLGAGGVGVSVSDGARTWQTVSQSAVSPGAWSVSGLAIPGTYTVTFSRADLAPQIVSVSLDAHGSVTSGAQRADRVNATMRSSTAQLTGTVSQTDDRGVVTGPAPNVTVTLSSGSAQYEVSTASTPAAQRGRYAVDALPPGTYTVTFSRSSTASRSSIVTLVAGQSAVLDATLASPASIRGKVTQAGADAAGVVVNLYRASDYGTAAGPVASTVTSAAGGYAFPEVEAPQHYLVEVRLSPSAAALATSAVTTVQNSQALVVDVALPSP